MKTSTPILHSARLKEGGAKLRVLRNPTSSAMRRDFEADVREIMSRRKDDIAGYAVLVWSIDGDTSTTANGMGNRLIGKNELPDFVKTAFIRHYEGRE